VDHTRDSPRGHTTCPVPFRSHIKVAPTRVFKNEATVRRIKRDASRSKIVAGTVSGVLRFRECRESSDDGTASSHLSLSLNKNSCTFSLCAWKSISIDCLDRRCDDRLERQCSYSIVSALHYDVDYTYRTFFKAIVKEKNDSMMIRIRRFSREAKT
jgi:hypothetical protein